MNHKIKQSKYSERYFVNKLVPHLRTLGAYVYIDQDTGHERTKSGWDFCYGVNGYTIFVEVKMENNKLTDYQKHTKDLIVLSGGKYIELHLYKMNRGGSIERFDTIVHTQNHVATSDELGKMIISDEKLKEAAGVLFLELNVKIKLDFKFE